MLNSKDRWPDALAGTIVLAAGLWFVTFYLSWSVFWIKISASAFLLAMLSFLLQPFEKEQFKINFKLVVAGILSAALLYGIFFLGKAVSTLILPFAGDQIGGIYGKGVGTSSSIISLLLFFITGPAEEIYWRGYLQKNLMARYGNMQGWLVATAVYAGVHIWSFNFMLVGAAAVAGAFWGAMYWRFNNLWAVIISHSIWSTVIFAFLPMN
ncbi:MAG: CPBP family intramembrane metalloprotease [Proteobacteria bacterium]|nr:CPBP family intramembrane metalloprotease [Pseudomonadota bacterium]MBU4469238.1 CPBP family intramembrane metalloprotease [Pseudomonadota bacterium]MCG2752269.1 CPBP family glutamic-type intramembrane protease [Desulfobacteraceae bacterium]